MFHVLIGRLDLGYLVDVLQADSPDKLVAGLASPLLDACSFFEEVCGWRRFDDEGEGAVGLNGNECGGGDTRLQMRGARVELLAEVH